jgi:TolB-like protein
VKHLAVLPFENLGPAQDEYFADGVADAVRGKLAALPGLQVTASNSSSQYKKTTKTAQEIGQELGVQYLLIGRVRWQKGTGGQSRVEVSPEPGGMGVSCWRRPIMSGVT